MIKQSKQDSPPDDFPEPETQLVVQDITPPQVTIELIRRPNENEKPGFRVVSFKVTVTGREDEATAALHRTVTQLEQKYDIRPSINQMRSNSHG